MTISDNSAALAQPTHRVRRQWLHSQHQAVVVMRADCDVCRVEGFAARSPVLVANGKRQVQATLFQVEGEAMLALNEIGLSGGLLGVAEGDEGEGRPQWIRSPMFGGASTATGWTRLHFPRL